MDQPVINLQYNLISHMYIESPSTENPLDGQSEVN